MTNRPKPTIKGTIYIAPGNSGCRVYAMPYRMRPDQSPRDLQDRFADQWTLAAQLDHQLKIITLEVQFRHLREDIEGQMAGTILDAEWTPN